MAEKILDHERAAFELVARNNPHFSDCHTFTVSDGFDAYDEPDVQATFEIWQEARRAVPAGWDGLTGEEKDQAVHDITEYGTDFVTPLYALIEGIEEKLKQRNTAK